MKLAGFCLPSLSGARPFKDQILSHPLLVHNDFTNAGIGEWIIHGDYYGEVYRDCCNDPLRQLPTKQQVEGVYGTQCCTLRLGPVPMALPTLNPEPQTFLRIHAILR